MAITASIVGQGPGANLGFITDGSQKRVVVDLTMDNSYSTGGKAFLPSDVGFASHVSSGAVNIKTPPTANNAADVHIVEGTSPKVKVTIDAHAEVPNTTDLTGMVVRATLWGI